MQIKAEPARFRAISAVGEEHYLAHAMSGSRRVRLVHARIKHRGERTIAQLFPAPCCSEASPTPHRPPLSIGLPDYLLGLCGGHSAGRCRFRLILSSGQFSLRVAEFAD